ncbi:uncharacterized protein [Ambystoma mexicanum]|uniref:uncharacterized protein n=1 Tax=Ambystoma mexicanum TaxID=8296 RepID=UPI0037E7A019
MALLPFMLWLGFMCMLYVAPRTVKSQDVFFGLKNYTEYRVGNMSMIISVPHGGAKLPNEIPSRDAGCWNASTSTCLFLHNCPAGTEKDSKKCKVSTMKDMYTLETALNLAEEIYVLTGGYYPHVVINHLGRSKLDANRGKEEATFGAPEAENAWEEFMSFINSSKSRIGQGILFDIHGQAHSEGWIELGYTLSKSSLDSGKFTAAQSSIYHLAQQQSNVAFETLLRGDRSLGTFIEEQKAGANYICVPSPKNPGPNGGNYFSGGYITETFGSKNSGMVDAIQIEVPRWIRENNERPSFCVALAKAIMNFLQINYCNQTESNLISC